MMEFVERLTIGVPGATTMKSVRLVAVVCPATSTVILPVVASDGTVAVISVPAGLTLDDAAMPLKKTAGVAPKLAPEMTTVSPTEPVEGAKEVIVGPVTAAVTEIVPKPTFPDTFVE